MLPKKQKNQLIGNLNIPHEKRYQKAQEERTGN